MKKTKAKRKAKKLRYNTFVVLRVSTDLRTRLEAVAQRERRPFAQMTRLLLENALAKLDKGR